MTRKLGAVFASVTLALCSTFCQAASPGESDVRDLVEFFEGRFDSTFQYTMEAAAGLTPAERHARTRLVHAVIAAPAMGKHVIYVEEFALANEGKITRRRIATFALDKDAHAIRMKLFDMAKVSGDPPTDLRPDQLTPLNGCDVLFHEAGGLFEGAAEEKACVLPVPSGEPKEYMRVLMTVTSNQIMRTERIYYIDSGMPADGRPEDDTPAVHFKAP